MSEEYTVKDLNPRSQAVKSLETSVVRCIQLIEEFDKLAPGMDWMDVPMAKYRTILGNDHYKSRNMVAEMFKRYESGTLYGQVQDLAANLPPDALKRKEIKDGLHRINTRLDSPGKGRPPRPNARRGR